MAGRSFPIIRMKGVAKLKSPPPFFETRTEVIEHDTVGVKTFTIRAVHRNKLRRQVQNLLELYFLLPDLFLGALLFAQVEDERDAIVSTFKQGSSEQHWRSAAISPEKLLLVWLNSPGCQSVCQGTFVALAPFGRRQIRPA